MLFQVTQGSGSSMAEVGSAVFLPGLFALNELVVASVANYPEDEDLWCQAGRHSLCHSALGIKQLHRGCRAQGYPPVSY